MLAPPASYDFPAECCCIEQEIKRSRFISNVAHATDKAAALHFIQTIRQQYPDARHHCWAYVAGSPTTVALGMSDDGEPQGTAGKPMLNVLHHKKIGEIVVVVSRYFGGIKLGAGGLVRAYASSVQLALDVLPLRRYTPTQIITLSFAYPLENMVRHTLEQHQALICHTIYTDTVQMFIEVAMIHASIMQQQLINQSKGTLQCKQEIDP